MKYLLALMLVIWFGPWIFSCTQEIDRQPQVAKKPLTQNQLLRIQTSQPKRLRGMLQAEGIDVTGSNQGLGLVEMVCHSPTCKTIVDRYARLIQAVSYADPTLERLLQDYHDPAQVEALLDDVEANYPHIAQKFLLADDLPEGGVIWAMKISDNVSVDEDEATFLMDGQTHAREVMTAEVMLDAIATLTQDYGEDPKVTRWVDNMEIWIVPVVNPDGAWYVHTKESWWRKNRSRDCESPGVDLNRNFAWNYRACPGSDNECASPLYHGPGPASEPETQAMQNLMLNILPLYYLNYHSFGEYLIWPTSCARTAEHEMFQTIAQELNQVVETDAGLTGDWTLGTAGDLMYTAPGGADDFAYGAAGAIAFTFEINASSFQPDYATWRDLTCQRQRAGWQHLLDRTLDGPSLSGHVRDAQNKKPIAAKIYVLSLPLRLGQENLRSDQAGRFGRVVAPNTDHQVLFAAQGYLPQVYQIQVGLGPSDTEVLLTKGTNHAPEARAGDDFIVQEGDVVRLDAHLSNDPDGSALIYSWKQIQGPAVELDAPNRPDPSFFAPGVDADTRIGWELTVSDGLLTAQDQIEVVIQNVYDDLFVFACDQTPNDIPDANLQGLTSVIQVASDSRILKAVVHLDITHDSVGDLQIVLVSPSGSQIVLQEPFWSAQVDLHQDFPLDPVISEMSSGAWALRLTDVYAGDRGVLEGCWLGLELVENIKCEDSADCRLPRVAQARCQAGLCQVDSCEAGFGDCNFEVIDGCETPLGDNPHHCGSCQHSCQAPFAQTVCQSGVCLLTGCDESFADCNQDVVDGCEVELMSNSSHCGQCSTSCNLAHARSLCSLGDCLIDVCETGFADCDHNIHNGCEVSLSVDDQHCGACQKACLMTQQCRFGVCVDRCQDADQDGYQDITCGGLDCNDQDDQVFPTQKERCNGVDDDCDTKVDEQGVCQMGCASLAGKNNRGLIWILFVFGCFAYSARRSQL